MQKEVRLFCGLTNVEDEIHFLFYCHNYSSIRDDFYNKMYNRLPNSKQLSLNELIIKLLNFEDYFINTQLLKFITSCFDKLSKLLSVQPSEILFIVICSSFTFVC